jgi:hypothetical protein
MTATPHSGKNLPETNVAEKSGGASPCVILAQSYGSCRFNYHDRRSDVQIADSGAPTELRADQRFSANMELRYSYRSGGFTYIGTGRTWNLSNTAVCFEIDQELRAGDLEVRISWPSRLQHICALELVLRGRVGRKGPNFAVLQMDSYEFQTFGDRSFNSLTSRGVTCNIAA